MSVLLPPGIDSLLDAPHQLSESITMGLVITSWDELEPDERPPREIWLQPEKLKVHFEEVEKQRKAKYGSEDRDPIEDPVQNEAARGLLVS